MSNTVNENLCFSGMALNQSSTAAVFFHWFSAVLRLKNYEKLTYTERKKPAAHTA